MSEDTVFPSARAASLHALIRAAWAAVLEHDRFDDDEEFFAVGGHSVLTAKIMAGLSAHVGVRLPLRLFFENPTVNALAAAIASQPSVRLPSAKEGIR